MNEHLETLQRIQSIAEEALTIEDRIKEWEIKFSRHQNPHYTALGAAVGELTGKFEYIKIMLDCVFTPHQQAICFASDFELELGLRQRVDPDCHSWYKGGYISAEEVGDNGENDKGFDLTETNPSKQGLKKSHLAHIGVTKVDGNWRVLNQEDTPVTPEQLIDWLEGRCE